MNAHYDDRTLKLFLLGELPEEQRAGIELASLDSPALFERIEALESELLLDFAQGRLPRADRVRVETVYRRAPERRRRLEEARALVAATAKPKVSRLGWMFAAAASVVFAIVGGAILTKVREPAPVVIASLRLKPGVTRGVSGDTGTVLKGLDGSSDGVVRIYLSGGESFSTPRPQGAWRVTLRLVDAATDGWSSERTSESAGAVVVDVPARFLVRGDYLLRLTRGGVAVAAYQFRVD